MKLKTKNFLKFLVIGVILVLALFVRKKNYAEIPIPGQSVDEYSYSWVGLSLIRSGMPVGVSGIDGYKNSSPRYVNVDRFFQTVSTGEPLTINYPWMDHPPLLSLITGGYTYLSGGRVFEDARSYVIRKPIIIISTISVGLLIAYCWINFSYLTAVISGLLYATTPLVVLSGRMIQAENAIIPCLLACMISVSLYIKKKRDLFLFLAGLIAGIATLFKLNGVVCHLFVFFSLLSIYKKINKKFIYDFCFFLLISLPISFLYVIYGSVYGIDNFKNILFSNYNRFYGIGPNSLIELLRNQRLTQHKFLPEASIISGWIVFLMFLKNKKLGINLVIFGLLSYLIIYIFFGSQPYGWYAFPFWPLLIILVSRLITEGVDKGKNILASYYILIFIIGANISRLVNVFEFQPVANYWRIGVSFIFFVMIVKSLIKSKGFFINRILLLLLIILVIYTNILYLNKIDIDFWWQNIS